MVYGQNFVVCLKTNGEILREFNNEIRLPFKSEYSILLKNLNTVRALVTIEIDGKNIGRSIIIPANDSVEIERFINDDLNKGYKFKFIEKTDDIINHRGNKIDDGIIRVTYKFEKHITLPDIIHSWYIPKVYDPPYKITYTSNTSSTATYSADVVNLSSCSDQGITVPGNDSNQQFQTGSIGFLEDREYVLNIVLKGYEDDIKINKPITIKTKFVCETCGKSNKSSHKFCSNCGTRLI